MKKILLSFIYLGFFIYGISQTINLKTNGYNLKFTKIDTLFYLEYPTSSPAKVNASKNDINAVSMKYTFGKISKSSYSKEITSFTTNYYVYQDGTLQAPTSQLFFKPMDIIAFRKTYNNIGIIEEHPSLIGYYYLYVTNKNYNTGESIFKLCNKFYNEKSVIVIEPVFSKQLKQENPLRPWEWNIRNNANVAGGIIGADMGIENAWCFSTGTGARIAVIDDGVDLTHPDLQANLLPGFDATGNNSGGAPTTNNGHGTNCAGIIVSVNNLIGTIGVAFNSRVIPKRMGIVNPITGAFNTNDAWIANCFAEAVARGADVISNSWGGGSPSTQIDAAITNAINNGRNGRGCVVLFAAGNRNSVVQYPATIANVIAVGASTPCDTRKRSSNNPTQVNPGVSTDAEGTSCDGEVWWGSNFGTGLDLLAPGVLIRTTDNVGANGFVAGDFNDRFNGTSAGCPSTAAVVALIIAANNNLTGVQARNILEQTCFKIPNGNFQANVAGQPNGTWSNQAGYGRVDAERALRVAAGIPNMTISGASPVCSSPSQYSVTNLPCISNVAWSASPTGLVNFSCINCVQTNISAVGNGTVTLTAIINSNGHIQNINRQVRIGTYTTSEISFAPNSGPPYYGSNPPPYCWGTTVYFGLNSYSAPDANSYQWYYSSNWQYVSGQGTRLIRLKANPTSFPSSGSVGVIVGNACGNSSVMTPINYAFKSNCTGSFTVSPNPSSDIIAISQSSKEKNNLNRLAKIQEVLITDKMGVNRLRKKFGEGISSASIHVRSLPNDIYTLRIFDGESWQSEKIIIQH